jgi:hypothetical protein
MSRTDPPGLFAVRTNGRRSLRHVRNARMRYPRAPRNQDIIVRKGAPGLHRAPFAMAAGMPRAGVAKKNFCKKRWISMQKTI